jgi:hypothetical protein
MAADRLSWSHFTSCIHHLQEMRGVNQKFSKRCKIKSRELISWGGGGGGVPVLGFILSSLRLTLIRDFYFFSSRLTENLSHLSILETEISLAGSSTEGSYKYFQVLLCNSLLPYPSISQYIFTYRITLAIIPIGNSYVYIFTYRITLTIIPIGNSYVECSKVSFKKKLNNA